MIKAAMRATAQTPGRAVRFVRNPGAYTKREQGSGAVLIFLALLAIAVARKQAWPTWHEAGVYAIAAAVVALAASVAPEFLTTLMIVALLVVVLGNANLIADYTTRGVAALNSAISPGAAA